MLSPLTCMLARCRGAVSWRLGGNKRFSRMQDSMQTSDRLGVFRSSTAASHCLHAQGRICHFRSSGGTQPLTIGSNSSSGVFRMASRRLRISVSPVAAASCSALQTFHIDFQARRTGDSGAALCRKTQREAAGCRTHGSTH